MHSDVGIVVLIDERFDRLAIQERHVLADRITRLHIICDGHQLLCVLDTQNLQHLTVQLRQVINLWGTLCQLDRSLVLHDPLRHRCAVGIADRNNLHQSVVAALGPTVATGRVILIVLRCVVPNDRSQQLELLLHRSVYPRLNRTHGLQRALKQRQGSAHRGVTRHISDLHVTDGPQTPRLICDLVQQRQQGLARLLVRQGHDVVTHCPRSDINVPELTRSNGSIVTLNPQPTSLQTTRQVSQRACVNQLANQRCACTSVTTDQVNQPEAISPKTGDVRVLYKVLALEFGLVALVPVPANSQNLARTTLNSHHIRQRDAVLILVPGHIPVNVNLQ